MRLARVTLSRIFAASAMRALSRGAAYGAAVFIFTLLTLGTPGPDAGAPLIWISDGVGLAILLKSRPRSWLLLLIFALAGKLAGRLVSGDGFIQGVGISVIDTLEILGCALALHRLHGETLDLTRWRHLARFAGIAGLLAPIASNLAAALWINLLGEGQSASAMAVSAAADSLGFIILTPCLLTFSQLHAVVTERPFKAIDCLILAVLAGVTGLIFTEGNQGLIFVIPALLLLVTLRTERLGAALGLISITVIGLGFLMGDADRLHLISDSATRMALIQAFLAVCAFSATPVAAVMAQQRRMRASLRAAMDTVEEAHAESLEQRRWVELAAGAAGVGYWRLDVRGSKISWSDEVYRMFGQVPGQSPKLEAAMAMVHPQDKEGADAKLSRALTTGQGYRAQTRIVHPNGDICYTLGQAVCELGPDGAVVAVMGAMYDITELKLTEIALSESEAKYRSMANNATDVLAGYRADGTFTYLSPAIRQVLGYAPDELIGRKTFDMMHMDDVAGVLAQFHAYVENPRSGPPRIQYRAWHKDGRVLWLEAHPRAFFGPDGALVEFQDVVRDITARKASEAALDAARVMAEFRAGGQLRA
jgi:PAS domain S-box-containing protein